MLPGDESLWETTIVGLWQWPYGVEPVAEEHQVTLGEGGTPIVRSRSIGPAAGLDQLWLKLDHCNPTASFKDRYAAVAISHMRAAGQQRAARSRCAPFHRPDAAGNTRRHGSRGKLGRA